MYNCLGWLWIWVSLFVSVVFWLGGYNVFIGSVMNLLCD